jgi:hypothetical protein
MVQVLLEDVTIAILFVRLAGAIGKRWAQWSWHAFSQPAISR